MSGALSYFSHQVACSSMTKRHMHRTSARSTAYFISNTGKTDGTADPPHAPANKVPQPHVTSWLILSTAGKYVRRNISYHSPLWPCQVNANCNCAFRLPIYYFLLVFSYNICLNSASYKILWYKISNSEWPWLCPFKVTEGQCDCTMDWP